MDQIKTGKFIAQLRKEKKMTQEAVGEKIGVTNKTVSRWENGHYMPDIDMLVILSELFEVSINELILGERVQNDEFKEIAEKNLVSALKNSKFDVKEKTEYFKKKWIKDNIFWLILCTVLILVVIIVSIVKSIPWLTAASLITGFIFNVIFRNKMMIYIENKIYK